MQIYQRLNLSKNSKNNFFWSKKFVAYQKKHFVRKFLFFQFFLQNWVFIRFWRLCLTVRSPPPTDWRFCVRHRTLASVQFKHCRPPSPPPKKKHCRSTTHIFYWSVLVYKSKTFVLAPPFQKHYWRHYHISHIFYKHTYISRNFLPISHQHIRHYRTTLFSTEAHILNQKGFSLGAGILHPICDSPEAYPWRQCTVSSAPQHPISLMPVHTTLGASTNGTPLVPVHITPPPVRGGGSYCTFLAFFSTFQKFKN